MLAKVSIAFALLFACTLALPISRTQTRALEGVPQYVLDFGKASSTGANKKSPMLTEMQHH